MASQDMKREVMLALIFILLLSSLQFLFQVSAAEEDQVELGYSCLETRINQTGCTNLNFEEKVFSYLATGECGSQLSAENSSNQCWPNSGCKIKSTAQAVLALNNKINTTLAEKWLLRQTSVPSGIDWFLEIEVPDGETTCTLVYPGSSPRTITIREDKTLSSGAGNYLTLSSGGYWLKINPALYNKEIYISCERQFITTLLFMKTGFSTVHVSESVQGAGAGGNVTEQVSSLCFAPQGQACNYEGSLWAALVLASLGYQEEISPFMPYLITMKDDPVNDIYLPESFLYYLTNKFQTDLLLKQKYSSYWEESGNRYYDTALALLPLIYDSSNEKSNSKSWLLSVQQKSGCWNNGNIRDTAFLLYSVWPKNPFSPVGECEYDLDCPSVECKYSWCENGECMYEYDGSCIEQECTKNSDCPPTDYSENYCDGDSVYRDTYTYSCDTSEGLCAVKVDSNLVEACSSSETCEDGQCVQESCSWYNPCSDGYECVSNVCVQIQGECSSNQDCEIYNEESSNFCSDSSTVSKTSYTYYCDTGSSLCLPSVDEEIVVDDCSNSEVCDDNQGKCVSDDTTCSWLFNPCNSGYDCIDGICVPEGQCKVDGDCESESCMEVKCTLGTCIYEYTDCMDDDYCCNPGCNYSNDNDCGEAPQCIEDSECSDFDYQSDLFCGGNNWEDVYLTFYNYTCDDEECKESWKDVLIQDCSSSQDCYSGECYGSGIECDCEDELDCSVGYTCVDCECVEKGGSSEECTDWWDCDYDEDCVNNKCVPYACDEDSDCSSGSCVNGECVSETVDCEANLYYCRSQASCDASGGNIMQDYSCSGDLLECCDVDASSLTCQEEGGEICSYDELCSGGTVVTVLDTSYDETCCVGGECVIGGGGGTEEYCEDNGGTCRDEGYCEENEDEGSYLCDYSYQSCCLPEETPGEDKPKRGWVIIVILLILIILAVLGIVFRDKVRTEWIKIKDKFSGKKTKKKFELPLSMQPNPQGRILPRRILPPGQHSAGLPQNSRFPMRTMGQPISRPPTQPTYQQNQLGKSPLPPQNKPATQQAPGTQKPETPQSSTQAPSKKPEPKPKNSDLDDVLKKLKEMGEK